VGGGVGVFRVQDVWGRIEWVGLEQEKHNCVCLLFFSEEFKTRSFVICRKRDNRISPTSQSASVALPLFKIPLFFFANGSLLSNKEPPAQKSEKNTSNNEPCGTRRVTAASTIYLY
jgi:hypothetical protein